MNNGGISQREPFENCSFAVVDKMMKVNALSPIALIKGFLPKMVKQGGGQIVNVLSISGLIGVPVRTMYSCSKFCLDGFGKALQGEVAKDNINILQVYPSYVQTNVSKNALVGNAEAFGAMDSNINSGLPVDEAVKVLLKAIYLKRNQIFIGKMSYAITAKLLFLSEYLSKTVMASRFKSQMDVIAEAKKAK